MSDISKPGRTTPWLAVASGLAALSPGRVVALLFTLQVAVWTIVPVLIDKTPPMDFLESLLWGREWVLLTYKHPQLPGWILDIAATLTGSPIWSGFLAAQLVVAATFLPVYALGRDMMGGRAALAGVLLLPTTGFFSSGTRQLNHDIMQMPFWAAICWLLWRAQRADSIFGWLVLGLVSGASLYAKFSTGLVMLFGAIWLIADPTARRRLATPGPWLALGIVLAFATPLLLGMTRMHFIQLTYATARDGWVMSHRSRFYYTEVQAALLSVFAIVLWSSGLLRNAPDGDSPVLLGDRRARGYLVWMGLGPAVLVAVGSLFTGAGEAWGKPMYDLVGLVAVAYLGKRLTDRALHRLVLWGFGLVLATAAIFAGLTSAKCHYSGRLTNSCVPGPEISARLQQDWHQRVNAPLDIVGGEEGLMMTVGALASDRPSMFTEFDPVYSPWITDDRLRRHGMLVVWGGDGPALPSVAPWTKGRPVEQETFLMGGNRPPLIVSYVVIPPGTTDLPPVTSHITDEGLTR